MTDDTPSRPPRRRRAGRVGLWTVFVFLVVFLFTVFAGLSLTGRALVVPRLLTDRLEEQMNQALGAAQVRIGRLDFEVTRDGLPRVRLRNVDLSDGTGARLGQLNELGVGLDPQALLRGRIEPSILRVGGAQITLRRSIDGTITLGLGGGGGTSGTLAGLLDTIEGVFDTAPLSNLSEIEVADLTLTLEDARSGRVWQATGGKLTLTNAPDRLGIVVFTEVFNGTVDLAEVQFNIQSDKSGPAATLAVNLNGAAAADIALQSPALSYLGLIDAPISGALRTSIGEDGALAELAATLDISAGALRPNETAKPVPFDRGRIYLSFDPLAGKITFSQIEIASAALQATAQGHAYLDVTPGTLWPEAVVGQLAFTNIRLDPEGMFPQPIAFNQGHADFRLGLQPFGLTLGQAVIVEGDRRITARGHVDAEAADWSVALDASINTLDAERLMQLWPLPVVPKTRAWMSENMIDGTLTNIEASVRLAPGAPPVHDFRFDFRDTSVRALRHMPPITDGRGHAALSGQTFALRLGGGQAMTPEGVVDLAGSTMFVPDIDRKPAIGQFYLTSDSTLTAVLSLIDNPPIRAMQRANRPVDLARGRARLFTSVETEFRKDVTTAEVAFDVSGRLTDFTSAQIAPGRELQGAEIAVTANPQVVRLSGPVTLDGLPLNIVWEQPLAAGSAAQSRVEGTIELSQRFTETFGISLPGEISGAGRGYLSMDVIEDGPVVFRLSSDLQGIGLDLPALGWRKAPDRPAGLEITGQLGDRPQIDRIAISGPGLDVVGQVTLDADGGFVSADFSRLEVGEWLDAAVSLEGQGGAAPSVRVTGGTLDLRSFEPGDASGTGAPIVLELDRLVISDTISLLPFRGDIRAGRALSGSFEAAVNAGAPIRGSLIPVEDGTAVRLFADDAGAVARSAGFMRSLSGGALDLILVPQAGGAGYKGQLQIDQPRLRDQPAMAELLDAISVVGILDELEGPGILFQTMDARFRLDDETLYLDRGVAVGASLGITLDGTYDLTTKTLDMEGVISPIYMLNGIGQLVSRRGEGLFGFNFRLSGPADDPKVFVNPLSILTPGALRDIFRSSPRPGATPGQ